MPVILQRTLFFAATVIALLASLLFGIAGAFRVSEYLFGPQPHHVPLVYVAIDMVLAVFGMSLSYVGMVCVFVLPLHFAFPNAAKPFFWVRKSSPSVYRFYQ